jgi:hypothetical protein
VSGWWVLYYGWVGLSILALLFAFFFSFKAILRQQEPKEENWKSLSRAREQLLQDYSDAHLERFGMRPTSPELWDWLAGMNVEDLTLRVQELRDRIDEDEENEYETKSH